MLSVATLDWQPTHTEIDTQTRLWKTTDKVLFYMNTNNSDHMHTLENSYDRCTQTLKRKTPSNTPGNDIIWMQPIYPLDRIPPPQKTHDDKYTKRTYKVINTDRVNYIEQQDYASWAANKHKSNTWRWEDVRVQVSSAKTCVNQKDLKNAFPGNNNMGEHFDPNIPEIELCASFSRGRERLPEYLPREELLRNRRFERFA